MDAEGLPAQFTAVEGANPRSREADDGRARRHVEFHDQTVRQEVADLAGFDLRTLGRGAVAPDLFPVSVKQMTR